MLSRAIPFGGTRSFQIRVETFNVLNRANFGFPTSQLFNADGTYRSDAGQITSTIGTPRQIQLGAKIVW
jgi:hypothetical protein